MVPLTQRYLTRCPALLVVQVNDLRSIMSQILRSFFIVLLGCSAIVTHACTFFKITKDGRTIVGNNEDAWSINSRVRFVNGGPGEYGAIYFSHFNGSPMRIRIDQGGMNSEGLVFDGLAVPAKNLVPGGDLPLIHFSDLMPIVMRTCATVHEAEALIRKYDTSLLNHAFVILVDRNGDYLIAEGDTLYTGNDAIQAFGNFRMSACSNLDSVPIQRYQKGRALLAEGAETSLSFGTAVLDRMAARRSGSDERSGISGTLYSNLYDPQNGIVNLYFYHDYATVRSFNVKEELAKGDHEVEMASLFPENADFKKLEAYTTPFHARWLFYALVALLGLAGITALYCCVALLRRSIARSKGSSKKGSLDLVVLLLSCIVLIVTIPFLLLNEGVYYFGLGDATDPISSFLKYLPVLLCALLLGLLYITYTAWRGEQRFSDRWFLSLWSVLTVSMVGLFVYWGMVIP